MKNIAALLLPFILFLQTGCDKEKKCNAGSGGDLKLMLRPEHHEVPIPNSVNYRDTAYIKFGATELPGINPSDFDLVIAGEPGTNYVSVNGLKCGQYFIMMTGYDTTASWNTRVIGGLAVKITETEGSKIIVIPVSEN